MSYSVVPARNSTWCHTCLFTVELVWGHDAGL